MSALNFQTRLTWESERTRRKDLAWKWAGILNVWRAQRKQADCGNWTPLTLALSLSGWPLDFHIYITGISVGSQALASHLHPRLSWRSPLSWTEPCYSKLLMIFQGLVSCHNHRSRLPPQSSPHALNAYPLAALTSTKLEAEWWISYLPGENLFHTLGWTKIK